MTEVEKGHQFPGAGVTDDVTDNTWMLGTEPGSSVRATGTLTTVPHLQPLFVYVAYRKAYIIHATYMCEGFHIYEYAHSRS